MHIMMIRECNKLLQTIETTSSRRVGVPNRSATEFALSLTSSPEVDVGLTYKASPLGWRSRPVLRQRYHADGSAAAAAVFPYLVRT